MVSMIGRSGLVLILALLAMGGVAVIVESQSPSNLYWTGDQVTAVSEGGVVFYQYGNRQYTITDDHRSANDTQPVSLTVFVDPGQPSRALVDGPIRWLDAALVAVWFLAAAALLPLAMSRQRRRLRLQAEFSAGDVRRGH
jgi:hypothetical protein